MAKYRHICGHLFFIYTADDEYPNCVCCDRFEDCADGFQCGPEYGWANYIRTIDVTEEAKKDD